MFVVQRTPYVTHSWSPVLTRVGIPISVLVTFLFAYILTRPIRALSHAFRQFSAGNLDARVSVSPSRWGGLGGADVKTLMVDFNHMAERVKELIEAQKLLVRDISHELRSPLARIRLALELAREDSPEPLLSLERADLEAERLNGLIGEMLTLSLLESLREVTPKESFSVALLWDTLLPDMRFEAEAQGVTIRYENKVTDVYLLGRADMFRRALENIVRNAIRYTPRGEIVEITVSSPRPIDPDFQSMLAQIVISDRGPGVPSDALPKLFRPFFRVDMACEDSSGGFGVGLAIAERAVHLNGGEIKVQNRVGGGLRVEIIVPKFVLT